MTTSILLQGLPIRQSPASWGIKAAYEAEMIEVDLDTGQIYEIAGDYYSELPQREGTGGYLSVDFYSPINNAKVTAPSHIVIAFARWGDVAIVDGVHVDHINGKPDDNRITNLQILTAKDNIRKGHFAKKGFDQTHYKPLTTLRVA